jgi:hypothetical protein
MLFAPSTEPIRFRVGGFVQTAFWKVRSEPFGSRLCQDGSSERKSPARHNASRAIPGVAASPLSSARLYHASGGELEQIQFLLGHVSVQTTERYRGCKQRIRSAVNDRIGTEPNP